MADIKRNLESGGGLYINRWITGLVTQRPSILTPMSAMGIQLIQRMDALWDGVNIEPSHTMTLQRRPGFDQYSSVSFNASEYPQSFYSFKNTTGTIRALASTPTRVATFTDSAITTVFTKNTTTQTSFQKVGDMLYFCDGTDAKKWDGTTVSKWGIDFPDTAPTLSFAAGSLTCQAGYKYVYVYKNSSTGHISSPSPVSANTLKFTNQTITISGICSTDTQVDKVDIYRTADGGADYYYLASVNNTGTNWSYADVNPDTALNTFKVVVPGTLSNNPPPDGISLTCFFQGRMWVASGGYLYFAGGPDITNGVPEECFPPANVFTLPGKITAMASTSQGLVVFTSSEVFVVLGSNTASYYVQSWQKNLGVQNQNCVCQDGDMLFMFTSNGQLFGLSDQLSEVGNSVQSQLAAFDPTKVSLALHRSGVDEGLFVSDGSTKMYRYSMSLNNWSTVYQPVGGVGSLGSIEVTTSSYKLLLGRSSGTSYILARNPNVFTDAGTTYPAWVTVGSLVLAPPGTVAEIKSILVQSYPVGTYPTVSVLLNEISGNFVTLPNPVADPPSLPASKTLWSQRHYLSAAQSPLARVAIVHMQVKFSFPSEAAKNEIVGMAVA